MKRNLMNILGIILIGIGTLYFSCFFCLSAARESRSEIEAFEKEKDPEREGSTVSGSS